MRLHTRAEVEVMSEVAKVDLILALEARLCALEPRVLELEARIGLNSRNSSKPPSSDGPAKPIVKSLREKSGRSPGGQPGHPGTTLRQVVTPDRVETYGPQRCACGCDLAGQPVTGVERYQVFDLPEPRMAVTEHQVYVTICPACETKCKGVLPPEVSAAPVQYGPRVHDCWAPYFAYEGCTHGLCGAHLLRELKFACEEQGQVKHRDALLCFVSDPQVPFTSNLAEQGVRMAKVPQKISGCLRTIAGARRFARLRSYISALNKQHRHILTNIAHANTGIPWIP